MAVSHAAAILTAGVLALSFAGKADAASPQASALKPSPLFMAYRRLCLAHQGEPLQALDLATAQGWSQPAEDDRLPLGALSMTDGQQWQMGAPGARVRLVVGHAADPAGLGLKPSSWRVCIVSSDVADAGAASALAAWASVPPTHGSNPAEGAALFVIAQSPGGAPRTADGLSDAQIQTLVDRHEIVALGSNRVGENTILLYATPAS